MNAITLSHRNCVMLVRSPERRRRGMVSVDGRAPISLTCLVLDNGDLIIPTGPDQSLIRMAAGRPVTVEFTHRDRTGRGGWIITGTGLAGPMRGQDWPRRLPYGTLELSERGDFGNGIRVMIARMTGRRIDDESEIPAQRTGPE